MNNSPFEFLAQKYGNIVKYDRTGNIIGVFVRFYKCKSSDLLTGLPEHTHPAFVINGVEQDSILLGKYKVGENGEDGGALLSMPNIIPAKFTSAEQMLSRIRVAGPNVSGMTCADYGFIKLLAQKEGWTPKGNTCWGQSHKDGATWKINESVQKGVERTYKGYVYKCLIEHTTAEELKPDDTPRYWEKGEFIGGVSQNNKKSDSAQIGHCTLNGSGPLDWYLGNNPGNLVDIIGSSMVQQYGYRIFDCELQILENNNAADQNADLSSESAAWMAILPNKNNDGYTLVPPGTAGTLHWNLAGSVIQLDIQCDSFDNSYRKINFKDLTANTSRLPYVPSIVKELGLFPTGSSDNTEGCFLLQFSRGERFPRRGGAFDSCGDAGLGSIDANYGRNVEGTGYGGRSRCFDSTKSM